jgi:hypothetical protein
MSGSTSIVIAATGDALSPRRWRRQILLGCEQSKINTQQAEGREKRCGNGTNRMHIGVPTSTQAAATVGGLRWKRVPAPDLPSR